MSFEPPAPDLAKLQQAWAKWERGEETPGRVIADLPGHYLNWFALEGFPRGEIGRLLQLMQEIDRIGANTEWNGDTILTGAGGLASSTSGLYTFQVGANAGSGMSVALPIGVGEYVDAASDALGGRFDTAAVGLATAQLRGWLVHHTRPARIKVRGMETYRTPIAGHAGFPDLVLARRGRVIYAELKAQGGQLREDQIRWRDAMCPPERQAFCGWFLWRPSDWAQIERVLE